MSTDGFMATMGTALWDRTLPDGSGEAASSTMDSLNLIFIVGFAILISFLARYLAKRGGRGGKK